MPKKCNKKIKTNSTLTNIIKLHFMTQILFNHLSMQDMVTIPFRNLAQIRAHKRATGLACNDKQQLGFCTRIINH
jgi:hypothetical protein